MEKIIIFLLVFGIFFSVSSSSVCKQELTNEMQIKNKSEVSIISPDSCNYAVHIEYDNLETYYIGSMVFNQQALEKDDNYFYYTKCSGDNIWNVVKVNAEQAFYIKDIFINFTCNITEKYGALSCYLYNSDNDYRCQSNIWPDFKESGIRKFVLHASIKTPLPPGTWYYVFLTSNKVNCSYNLTIVTSVPYDFSVKSGNNSILYKGLLFHKSINIKNSLIGWFSPITPESYLLFLTYNKYSYTTPSNEKTIKRFIGINGYWKADDCPWGDGTDDCYMSWYNNNTLFSSEQGIWNFNGITLKIRCFSQMILLYADVVLPE